MTARTDDGFDIATCRSCQAPIIWATSKGGKAMPVDAEPVDDGNVVLDERPGEYVGPVASVLTGPSLLGGPLRKAHFTTCPQAAQWRRR